MSDSLFRFVVSLCLALVCWISPVRGADTVVVRGADQLRAALESGNQTPLDALTPHGKRQLVRSLFWDEDGTLVGFDAGVLTRELQANQLTSLLRFLNAESYMTMFSGDLSGPPLRLPEPSPVLAEKVVKLEQLAQEDVKHRSPSNAGVNLVGATKLLVHYQNLFEDQFTPQALRKQAVGNLLPLFDAANTMNFYHPGTALKDLMNVQRELAARGVSTIRWIDSRILDALLRAHRFDEARAFITNKPALATRKIPNVIDSIKTAFNGRSLYRYDDTTDTLTREAAPATDGVQLVMIVQENCQPSARALRALREDVDLQARLRQANLLLVTNPSASIPLRFISTWNKANPTLQMRAPYSIEEWKDVVPTGVPEFFVLRNGKPVGRLVGGWPHEGNKAALLSLIEEARK